MTEASNNYRLFKVAKELNTGSSTLVEHLIAKGFTEVNNSPNEKLSEDMYNALVREFASEKVLKQKADQIKEAKQERRSQREEPEHEAEEEILSARDLKSGILDAKGNAPKLELKPRVQQNQQQQNQPVQQQVPQPQPQQQQPPVQEEKLEIAAKKEPEVEQPGLKVLGKVDLSQFDRKKTVKPENKPQDRRQDRPQQQQPPQQQRNERRDQPRPQNQQVDRPAHKPAEQPAPKQVVETPKVEEKPQVIQQPAPEQPQVEVPVEPQEVMRASDNAEKLRGLNVLGKIELPDVRRGSKLKSKDSTPASSTPGTATESEEDKKKRRRKRKRSKPGGATPGTTPPPAGGQGVRRDGPGGPARPGNRDRGPVKKKEEPNQKELNEQVRSILADMNKGASRSRQGMRSDKRARHRERREHEYQREQEEALILEVTEFISANELANLMDLPVTELITKCMEVGQFISINQRLDSDIIQLLAEEYGFEVRFVDIADKAFEEEGEIVDSPEDLLPRAPIVTVMGHVDHGKTSLLDYVRKENVIAGEAGGITQHIGAYEVTLEDGRNICFLDTPGHEAFTAMRARGARVTDIAIIVIAADDSVMPQTKEAINHAEAAGVPMVFALNKIDKPHADPERIRRQLSEINIVLEEWGGKFQSQEISAKSGKGMKELLDKVLLEAEILDLKANPNKPARGTVIESRLDKGRGAVATVLVQDGTLKIGDAIVGGVHSGRVRALMDERGKRIKSAGPSTPVQLLGLTGTPQAGDRFIVYEDERKAKEVASRRTELFREQNLRQQKRLTLEEVARRNARGEFKELKIIVKGDVDGSVEALSDSLLKLSMEEVAVSVIRKAVGQISEADVLLASASEAIIIGFQVRPSVSARKLAETEGIDIRHYSVIYDAINDVKDALEGLLSPDIKEEITGTAEIRSVFKITKVGAVAGCMVTDGSFNRKDPIRLIREGIVIFTGNLSSLKRFKDDAREVLKGFECGMQINNYNDIREGDFIEQFRTTEVQRKLK